MCLTALKVDVDFKREGQISSKIDEGIDLENSKVSMRRYEGSDADDDDIKTPVLCSSFVHFPLIVVLWRSCAENDDDGAKRYDVAYYYINMIELLHYNQDCQDTSMRAKFFGFNALSTK